MARGTRAKDAGADPAEVCRLAPDGLAERLAWIRAEILPDAVASERLPEGVAVELTATPALRERLERLVRLESACCPDLAFAYGESPTPGRLRLEIRGVDPDAPIFRSLPKRRVRDGGAG